MISNYYIITTTNKLVKHNKCIIIIASESSRCWYFDILCKQSEFKHKIRRCCSQFWFDWHAQTNFYSIPFFLLLQVNDCWNDCECWNLSSEFDWFRNAYTGCCSLISFNSRCYALWIYGPIAPIWILVEVGHIVIVYLFFKDRFCWIFSAFFSAFFYCFLSKFVQFSAVNFKI